MKSVILLLIYVSTVFTGTPETAHIHIVQDIQGCSFPDVISIEIHILEDTIKCDLRRNTDVSTEVPMYIIQAIDNGNTVLIQEKSQLSEKSVAYQNKRLLIAVLITCSTLQDGQTTLKLDGSITYNGKEYTIKKSHRHRRQLNNDENDDEEYILHQQPELPPQTHDFKIATGSTQTKKEYGTFRVNFPQKISSRVKRQVTEYYIDIVVVIDYSIYRFWYLKSTQNDKRSDALNQIRLYYAIVANGINLRYKNIEAEFRIIVRLTSYVIAETSSASIWTENNRESSVPRDQVNSDEVLESFRKWIGNTDSLPLYDHIMLFTKYDLYSLQNNQKYKSTAGLAFIGAICETNGQATSVVEDEGGYQCIETAAHELGHSLGAKHDGMSDRCRDEDRYIMTAGSIKATPTTLLNPWKFSPCSIEYFRKKLSKSASTARGRQCIFNTLSKRNVPEVSGVLPGQLTSADDICQQIYGPSSRLCKGVEFGNVSEICTSMYCLDPLSDGSCYKQVAPRGLSCGDNKWCIDGECVYDFRAPDLDESCPFGDVAGVAFNNETCKEFVDGYPAYCYQKFVAGRCCASCKKYYIGVYGCEYGDKGYGCDASGCGLLDTKGGNYSATCCGTCNYRIPVPTTTTSTTRIITTKAAKLPTTSDPPACVDVKRNILGDFSCREVISSSPELCYNSIIQSECCVSCRLARADNIYCPYGDESPDECKRRLSLGESCSDINIVCCASCQGHIQTTDTATENRSSISIVVLLLCSVMWLHS